MGSVDVSEGQADGRKKNGQPWISDRCKWLEKRHAVLERKMSGEV
jgi:hypothetical protein